MCAVSWACPGWGLGAFRGSGRIGSAPAAPPPASRAPTGGQKRRWAGLRLAMQALSSASQVGVACRESGTWQVGLGKCPRCSVCASRACAIAAAAAATAAARQQEPRRGCGSGWLLIVYNPTLMADVEAAQFTAFQVRVAPRSLFWQQPQAHHSAPAPELSSQRTRQKCRSYCRRAKQKARHAGTQPPGAAAARPVALRVGFGHCARGSCAASKKCLTARMRNAFER